MSVAAADRPRRTARGSAVTRQLRALLDRPNAPYLIILGSAGLLVVLGLVMVLSASSVESYRTTGSSFSYWRKQAVFFAIGVPVLFFCSRLPVKVWRALAYPALIFSGVMLALVQVAGDAAVNGNRNWITVGGVQIQPSEAAKLALVLWGADLLARKHALLDQWKHLLVPLLPVSGCILLFVLLGNDLGTALVLMMLVLSLLFFAGAPFRLFVAVLGAGGVMAAMLASTKSNRVARLTSWLSPSADQAGYAYQALHGRLALGTGGFLGVGLGASREKWGTLPEAHNDFIFAIIGEELGLLGSLVVVSLFGALCYGGYQVALRSSGRFEHLAAAAVTTWLAAQTVINIGAVIGLMPVIGLPLPLVSAGGSALLSTMAAIGLLLSLARSNARAERAAAV
ncbi:cell division protein FtsW [Motilibacter peucedani]|uniref:Probable peptidoglycan glycosyltransferase FtsW n=1 Tax=Motilibacter peucedani TaxID=598650 RepID=A0A420XPJ5_9ACTN|nr:putative lipid II flippase FtsW [Motilibacter peucedani]RKS74119.1 cell division protein FtsW [Motilibacter peucedani]